MCLRGTWAVRQHAACCSFEVIFSIGISRNRWAQHGVPRGISSSSGRRPTLHSIQHVPMLENTDGLSRSRELG
ncbi:unnamed protein product [Ectocarpus sp. 6 AP-2014]